MIVKKIFIALIVVAAAIAFVYFLRVSVAANVPLDLDGSSKLNFIDLSSHNKEADCWVAYSGKVYDLTSWLPRHPGSAAAIAPYCGTSEEFSEAFTKQHGTTKVGMLMKVGTLMGDFEVRGQI